MAMLIPVTNQKTKSIRSACFEAGVGSQGTKKATADVTAATASPTATKRTSTPLRTSASLLNPQANRLLRTSVTNPLRGVVFGASGLGPQPGAAPLGLIQGDVLEPACEVVVVRGHVEVAVARKVAEDCPLFARLVRCLRYLKGAVDRMRGLGSGQDPLAPREQDGRGEDVVLEIGLGADQPVARELRDQGRDTVIAETARVDRSRDEVVPEGMHRYERRQLARVAKVIREDAAGQC